MPYVPLDLAPGVYANGTGYQASGRWNIAHLVRWNEGALRPVGGWVKKAAGAGDAQVSGKARGCHAWRSNAGNRFLAIGTHSKLYVLTDDSTALYDITPAGFTVGIPDADVNLGYGSGLYGSGTYGTPREDSDSVVQPTTWQFDNFGEYLLAVCRSDGVLYVWNANTASVATAVTASAGTLPTNNKSVIVTDQRFTFVLDGRRVEWADIESYTDWEITATKQGGNFDIATSGELMTAEKLRGGDVLLLTSSDAHIARYVGPPLVWGFERVGDVCGIISPNASVVAGSICAWMGQRSFFVYDGSVRALPSDVSDRVFSNLNLNQRGKVAAMTNQMFGEVTWLYPSGSSTENDSYVSWNYRDNTWTEGSLSRTTGVDLGVFTYPIMVGADGYIYDHEKGLAYTGEDLPYCESGPIEMPPAGNGTYMVRWLIPDERTAGDVQATFKAKFFPNSTEYTYGPFSMASPTAVRFVGRQVSLKIQGVNNTDWRWGIPRIDVVPSRSRR